MLLMRSCFFVALSDFSLQTFAVVDPSHIGIREEGFSEGSIGPDDPTFDYSSLLPATSDPESSQNIFDTIISIADQYDLDRSWADDGEVTLGSLPNPLVPQFGDLLAFHDGDFPPEGWGDCEFPKMPACCEHGGLNIFCVWYQESSYVCPEHPEDYPVPRGPKEQATYRAVCCDQVKDGVGVGCVPVTGRGEQERYDIDYPTTDKWLDIISPPGGLRDFNNLHFNLGPSTCKSAYRRDEEIDQVFCSLPE